MKLIIVIMTAFLMHASASTFAQQFTLKEKNITLKHAFAQIRKQTGYSVLYQSELINKIKPIDVNIEKLPLAKALEKLLDGQDLVFEIKTKTVIVTKKEAPSFLDKLVDAFTPPIDVSGVVLDEKGAPLVGATVKVKGVNHSTTADAQGRFSLPNVDDKAVLIISFIGYAPKEVSAKANVSVSLEVHSAELREVNVAYGRTTQQALTGSVTVVKGEDIDAMPNRSFDRSLQGLVPGLLVSNGTGQPGGGVSNFVLRGISTAADPFGGSAVRNPLIVIDGIPVSQDNFQLYADGGTPAISNPLAQLNPSDIESLTVLKDASAIALYGARASNGVIVIITKKGKSGRTSFNFRTQTDIASRIDGKQEMSNKDQYLELLYESYRNSNPSAYSTDQAIFNTLTKPIGSSKPLILTRSDGTFYPATDWIGVLYNDKAITFSNDISMSGGSEKSNYYLNLEYTKQNGVLRKTEYDRKSLRFNFENRPNEWIKLGLNSTLSYNTQDYGAGLRSANIANVLLSPLNPVRFENGDYVFNHRTGGGSGTSIEFANRAAAAELNINRNTSFRGLSKIYAEVRFLDNFRFTSNLGADFMLAEAKEKADPRLYDGGNFSSGTGRIEEQDVRRANLITTNTLNFNKAINTDHNIGALLGQEAQIVSQRNLLIAVNKLSLPYYDQISSPGVEVFRNSGYNTKETLLSYFGQVNYDYLNKYYLSTSIRRDGSSRFGDDKRFGTYWSTGLGWIISNESFLKGNVWPNYLKLRGSIGAAGNAAAINAQTRYDQLDNILFLDGIAVSPTITPGSPDVHWESTFTWDGGIEARLLNNRFSITADIYKKYTSDLIYNFNLP